MFRTLLSGLTAVLVLFGSIPASALFLPISDDRRVLTTGHNYPDDPYDWSGADAAYPFEPFGANADSISHYAWQTSGVTPTLLWGNGGTALDPDYLRNGSALSRYSITFEVDVATPYSLSGELTDGPPAADTSAEVSLHTGTSTIFAAAANHDTITFSDAGVLAPGIYTLLVETEWMGYVAPYGNEETTFDFELAAVPEPGMTVLAALLLAGFVRWGCKQRRTEGA